MAGSAGCGAYVVNQWHKTMMNTASSFTSVLDGRKRKVRDLWQCGNRYYARIKVAYPGEDRAKTRRVLLKAGNVTAAVKELCELLVKRDKVRYKFFGYFSLSCLRSCPISCRPEFLLLGEMTPSRRFLLLMAFLLPLSMAMVYQAYA